MNDPVSGNFLVVWSDACEVWIRVEHTYSSISDVGVKDYWYSYDTDFFGSSSVGGPLLTWPRTH